MTSQTQLLAQIQDRRLHIGVAGLGYVGLPLACAFADAGFQVTGVDIDENRVRQLNAGESYIGDVSSDQVRALVGEGRLRATTDYEALRPAGAIILCVPTPLRKTKDPDVSHIVAASERIAQLGSAGRLIVLESTTYPGTTEEIILPRLSAEDAVVGQDFFLAFSPERIDPGRQDYALANTPKVIGGTTPACLEIAATLYATAVAEVVPVSGTATAEMVKLLENTFRAVNIALVNEMALMCDRLGLNVWEVVSAAATKPFGFMPFYPGPGMGGHCLPIDPHYLSWKLRSLDYQARFIDLAAEINRTMPHYVVGKISAALNDLAKPLRGSEILLLGIAYKPDVADIRESPGLDVLTLLRAAGAEVRYHDPFVPSLVDAGFADESVALTTTVLKRADCVVVVTNHSSYDWAWIAQEATLIVDTRNALAALPAAHIVTL